MHNSEKLYEKKGYYTYLNLNERKYNSSQNNRSSECCSKLLEANEVIHNSINLISHALLSDTSQDHISSFAQSAISSIPFSLQERAKESCYGTTGKKITVPSICVQSSLQTKCANSYDSEEGRSERSFPFFSSSCMPFNEKRHSTVRPTMDTISSNMSLSELFPLFQMQASDIKVACEFHQKYKHPKITFSIDSQKELNSSVSDAIVNENREADVIEYQKVNLIMGWEKDDKEQNTLKPQVSSLIKENKCIQQESFSSFDLKKHEQKRLSIIRKQITEARRFRDLFGVWVRKPWITDELEGKMWDEAEQNSDDEKEGTGKERQTLEEMKSMLIEAQEAGALPEEQRRLEKAIERKEKELEEEAKKSEMTGIERFEEAIAERSKGNEGKNEKESGRFFEMKRFVFNAAAPASHSRNIQTSPQPKQSQTRSFSFSSAEKNETVFPFCTDTQSPTGKASLCPSYLHSVLFAPNEMSTQHPLHLKNSSYKSNSLLIPETNQSFILNEETTSDSHSLLNCTNHPSSNFHQAKHQSGSHLVDLTFSSLDFQPSNNTKRLSFDSTLPSFLSGHCFLEEDSQPHSVILSFATHLSAEQLYAQSVFDKNEYLARFIDPMFNQRKQKRERKKGKDPELKWKRILNLIDEMNSNPPLMIPFSPIVENDKHPKEFLRNCLFQINKSQFDSVFQ